MARLTLREVRALRLGALLLTGDRGHALGAGPGGVARTVERMGAMQAQDLASAQWSVGVRLPGVTVHDVAAALERAEAIRTWSMRGTLHLVPPRDAGWMTALMNARPRAAAAARRTQLGLSDADLDRGHEALRSALDGRRLTRGGCLTAIEAAGVAVDGQRGYHILVDAAQAGVVCIAGQDGREQVFALLEDVATAPRRPERDEALGELASRYVRSHGPVAERDLARWTGLPLRDCRAGVAAAGDAVVAVETTSGPMLAWAAALDADRPSTVDLALPGFDDLLLGYADRAAQLGGVPETAVVPGGNGVFRSTLVLDGRVVGTWKRTLRARAVDVEAHDLTGMGVRARRRCERALQPYAAFLGREPRVSWA